MTKYAHSPAENAEPVPECWGMVLVRTMNISRTLKNLLKSTWLAALSGGLGLLAVGPQSLSAAPAPDPAALKAGRQVFMQICFACHQVNGQGVSGVFPPLAKSDFLLADHDRAAGILLHGRQGPITVNGHKYNNVMPQLNLSDRQIADVMTYILNSWGNAGGGVAVTDIARDRQSLAVK
jgi:nitrite reductase (NO-forming)